MKSCVATMEMFPLLKKSHMLCTLKSVGAHYHPNKVVCHFSLHIPVTFLRSEALLNHIADYLRFISKTQLLWFTLDTSYGHGCHLASRFCLDPNDYEVLFVVPGLSLSCCASWLLHRFSLSSHCTTLSSSCCASWLSHCLLPSSHCALRHPLVN